MQLADFGLSFQLYIGEKYSISILKTLVGQAKHKTNNPKNEFEHAKITDCGLANKEIIFLNPDETLEYDVLVPVGMNKFLGIEITDYQSAKAKESLTNETLKSQLILNPSDKAKRLKAELISILKAFLRIHLTR